MRHAFLGILFCLAVSVPASAQSDGNAVVEGIRAAYRQFDYEDADRQGRDALRRYSEFTVEELTEIHTILGLVAYNRGDLRESRRQFISALQLSPDLQLDPLLVSPKIVEFFEEIRADLSVGDASLRDAPSRYVLLRDPRPDAAMRSMIAPGWGQFYKGHTTKGWIVSALFGAAAAGAVGAHFKRKDAKDAYESAGADVVEDRYRTYNRWHKLRHGLVQGAAVVWWAGYVDALLTDAAFGPDQTRLALHASPRSLSLAVRF